MFSSSNWRYVFLCICLSLFTAIPRSAIAVAPDDEPPDVSEYRAVVSSLHPPADELWISEFDDESWRYVAIYRGWATRFNEVTTWHPLTTNMAKVKGTLIATELTPAGAIVGAELLRSSGSEELDAYALEAARTLKSTIAIPRNMPRQGVRIKVVALIGFLYPESGGKVRPHASVNDLEFRRFKHRISATAAAHLFNLKRPGNGSVLLAITIKQGRIVSVEADAREGSPALREFAVREFKGISETFPNSPQPEAFLMLPLVFR